jgi:hypothetical protein
MERATVQLNSGEIWIPVSSHPNYRVSNQGRVMNIRTCKVLAPMRCGRKRKQYSVVDLNGIRYKVHHLVLYAFKGPRPAGLLGCHKDDDDMNNALSNLEWGTPGKNARTCAELSDRADRARVLDMRACGVRNRDVAHMLIRLTPTGTRS